jgi:hypothetical protein
MNTGLNADNAFWVGHDPKPTLGTLSKNGSLSYIPLPSWPKTIKVREMILRRSVILTLGSMPLLARGVFSQTAVKARRVGLLSSGAPLTDTNPVVVGLTAGFSKRGYVVGSSLLFERRAIAENAPAKSSGSRTPSGCMSKPSVRAAASADL